MIKLTVGVQDLDHFAEVQRRALCAYKGGMAVPVYTKRAPRRLEEVLDGGSMYRVIKNVIQCRQEILGIEQEHDEERGDYCLIMCSPEIIEVDPVARRPFQGWRYLEDSSVPRDRGAFHINDGGRPPKDIEFALRQISLL